MKGYSAYPYDIDINRLYTVKSKQLYMSVNSDDFHNLKPPLGKLQKFCVDKLKYRCSELLLKSLMALFLRQSTFALPFFSLCQPYLLCSLEHFSHAGLFLVVCLVTNTILSQMYL